MNKSLKEEILKNGGKYIDSITEVDSNTAGHNGEFDYLVLYRFEESGDMGRFIAAAATIDASREPTAINSKLEQAKAVIRNYDLSKEDLEGFNKVVPSDAGLQTKEIEVWKEIDDVEVSKLSYYKKNELIDGMYLRNGERKWLKKVSIPVSGGDLKNDYETSDNNNEADSVESHSSGVGNPIEQVDDPLNKAIGMLDALRVSYIGSEILEKKFYDIQQLIFKGMDNLSIVKKHGDK